MGKSVIWPKRLVVYGAEDTVVKTIEPIAGPHVSSYSKNIYAYIIFLFQKLNLIFIIALIHDKISMQAKLYLIY